MEMRLAFDLPQASRVSLLLVKDGFEGEIWDDMKVGPS